MIQTKRFYFLVPLTVAFAQTPNPTDRTTRHEEHQTTSSRTSSTTTTGGTQTWNGRLVDAGCSALQGHMSSSSGASNLGEGRTTTSSSTSSEQSASSRESTSAADRRADTRTSDTDDSRQGRSATDRTTTSTQESHHERRETTTSADRSAASTPLRQSELDTCSVTTVTTDYALVTSDGKVYRLQDAGATRVSDILKNNKTWSNRISANNARNMNVKVTGRLTGNEISVESMK